MKITTDWTNYRSDEAVQMDPDDKFPAAVHRFHADTIAALQMAEVTGRPLLLRGLPGVGKSQTARAAAHCMGRPLLVQVIDGRTEPHDLMWRFDQLRRLADAQVNKTLADDSDYLSPQALWLAFNWQQAGQLKNAKPPVSQPTGWRPDQHRAVLLIDEIDKADPELPNALLEVLASNGFTVPVSGQQVQCSAHTRPLIIITTNEERELPQPFLRRCLVHQLALPKEQAALAAELAQIGHDLQAWLLKSGVRDKKAQCLVVDEVAQQVAQQRLRPDAAGGYLPGTSEFLDLVNALAQLWPGDAGAQRQQLKLLQRFTFNKSAALL